MITAFSGMVLTLLVVPVMDDASIGAGAPALVRSNPCPSRFYAVPAAYENGGGVIATAAPTRPRPDRRRADGSALGRLPCAPLY
jgi:hypothetical protein